MSRDLPQGSSGVTVNMTNSYSEQQQSLGVWISALKVPKAGHLDWASILRL